MRNGIPEGRTEYNACLIIDSMRARRRKENEEIGCKWAVISRYPGGTFSYSEKPLTYSQAWEETHRTNEIHDRWSPAYEIVKWKNLKSRTSEIRIEALRGGEVEG